MAAVNKLTGQKLLKVVSVFIGLGVVVYIIISFGLQERFKPTSQQQPLPANNQEGFRIDTENDGIYTNYKYGFKFEYSIDSFPFTRANEDSVKFYESRFVPKDTAFEDWIGEGMWLYAGVAEEKYRQFSLEEFEKNKNRPLNEPYYLDEFFKDKPEREWPYDNNVKIEDITTDGLEGFILYSYPTGGGGGTEPAYGYKASWRKGDIVITVGVYDRNDSRKDILLRIIQKVTNSMDFFL